MAKLHTVFCHDISQVKYQLNSLKNYENKLYYTDTFVAKPAGAFNTSIWDYIGYNIDDISGGAADTLYSTLRVDQLLTLEWKYLLPLNLLNIILMAVIVWLNLTIQF